MLLRMAIAACQQHLRRIWRRFPQSQLPAWACCKGVVESIFSLPCSPGSLPKEVPTRVSLLASPLILASYQAPAQAKHTAN